ncbi:uncharacterized protein LOC107365283 [Tetranychus urticae]|uniref:Uncharacterized protein n=1 Tax=Tetranychus urticae TaxID=32264 RepID=T1KLH3_TETUR|nr:uncharacterized protein LOC107365283 [Tetranychus urticae]
MSCGNHEISDYIFDLPMKISSSYMPKYFHIEIPEILSIDEDEDAYDFKIEKEAINMAEVAEEDKIRETERLLQSGQLKDFTKLKSFDDDPSMDQTSSISPILPGSPCLSILPAVPINGIVSSLPPQPAVNTISPPVPQPPPLPAPPTVSVTLSTSLPGQLSLPIQGSIPSHPPYPITNITSAIANSITSNVINCSNDNMNNVTNNIAHGSSSAAVAAASSSTSTTTNPIPVNSDFIIDTDVIYSFKMVDQNSMKCNNDVNNAIISRRNSVPTSLCTFQDNLGILRPMPSQFRCDSSKSNKSKQQEFIPKTRIDPADFESSSSSPFDDALLRAIDDKQELNHVFQHY